MNVGAPEVLVVLTAGLLPLACLGLTIWALVDAARRPDVAWQRAGQTRALWTVLLALGLVFCLLGLIVSIIYLVTVRPQLERAMGGPPPPYPPYPPTGPTDSL